MSTSSNITSLTQENETLKSALTVTRKLLAAYERGEVPPKDATGAHYDQAWMDAAPDFNGPGVVDQQASALETFQDRVHPWMMACFGKAIAADVIERNHRFLEEALELVQACGTTADEARQLVDYVYGRPVGEKSQEVGGVMVTLAALCLAQRLDMHAAGEAELARIWTMVDAIRAKQAAKPQFGPLPGPSAPAQQAISLTDERAHEILIAMSSHVDDWAERAESEPSPATLSKEAIRFILAELERSR